MKQVIILTTGECEHLSLGRSLKRYFPSAEFVALKRDSFTSTRIPITPPPPRPRGLSSVVDRFAQMMIASTDPGRDGVAPDLVLAVEDVELVNLDQIGAVTGLLRDAIKRHLDTHTWSSMRRKDQTAERLRGHCSFHLLCPMVEAYFFGESQALVRAGARRASTVDPAARDVEDFLTDDTSFLAVPDGKNYWAKTDRKKHPKRYLQYLVEPEGTNEQPYRETEGGARALGDLDWARVLTNPNHTSLARSLFADLADALDVDNPFPGPCHPLTSRPDIHRVLRNL
ncbi:hypothetical protein [Myxococcus fulvus]|uniref:hypothetical protein n=1 Tax=Myxococcus fulvus TaxID=33 RepID=UPI0020C0AFF2|nr:hypothetical protein [Myxococcus fulvus]MCK8499270.1 hypothetical protein [Myxococcus fulvus]